MTDLLIRGAALIVAGCIAAMLIGGLMEFARWGITRTLSAIQQTIYGLGRLIRAGSKACAWALKATTRWALRRTAASIRAVTKPLRDWLQAQATRLRASIDQAPMKESAERHDPDWEDHKGFAEDDDPRKAHASGKSRPSGYDDALALLGLADVEPLTNEILRQRYAEIIRAVHPDKGFPSAAFAQQVNAAVRTIRTVHGWR